MAFDDVALQKKAASEKTASERDVSRIDGFANGGTGDDAAAVRNRGKEMRGKFVSGAELFQGLGGACLAMAEAEVFADDDGARMQAFDDDLRDKFLWRKLREVFIERKNEDSLRPASVKRRMRSSRLQMSSGTR